VPHKDKGAAIGESDYRLLADFRNALRRFLAFSEQAARSAGLTPQQHQAILAIRSHTPEQASVSMLAEHLMIRPHSAAELVDRLVRSDLVVKAPSAEDRRRVALMLTEKADAILADLSATHLEELQAMRPTLEALLSKIAR
jgi:DNA-binding MarR family transcriptional regulator